MQTIFNQYIQNEAPNRLSHPWYMQNMRRLLLHFEVERICYLCSNKIITTQTYIFKKKKQHKHMHLHVFLLEHQFFSYILSSTIFTLVQLSVIYSILLNQ